ncbi:unnamed protein product [Meloidogyne enterolobii]|uniref:Uncharacterized protein n=1 Tax=Meloidogyne enterolobii TaxID=390850 RepID=A0ACB0XY50_MELEN
MGGGYGQMGGYVMEMLDMGVDTEVVMVQPVMEVMEGQEVTAQEVMAKLV